MADFIKKLQVLFWMCFVQTLLYIIHPWQLAFFHSTYERGRHINKTTLYLSRSMQCQDGVIGRDEFLFFFDDVAQLLEAGEGVFKHLVAKWLQKFAFRMLEKNISKHHRQELMQICNYTEMPDLILKTKIEKHIHIWFDSINRQHSGEATKSSSVNGGALGCSLPMCRSLVSWHDGILASWGVGKPLWFGPGGGDGTFLCSLWEVVDPLCSGAHQCNPWILWFIMIDLLPYALGMKLMPPVLPCAKKGGFSSSTGPSVVFLWML